MRISFVNTSSKQNDKPFRIIPLGSLYLLTILDRKYGAAVDLSFTDLRGVKEDCQAYHVPEADVYLHYITTPEIAEITKLVGNLRNFYPHAKHFAGGPHANIFPEESMRIFDSICIGEGEEMVQRMVEDLMNERLLPVYRQVEPIDINAYPFPDRKYLPKSAIVDAGLLSRKLHDLPGTSVLFSRGCPFNCHFCSNQYKGATRFRSGDLIVEETEHLKATYGVQALLLKDDQGIPTNRKIARMTLGAIGRCNVKWRAQSRANGVHPDTVLLAKESGCVEIAIAVESVSQKALDIMNKRIDITKAKEYLRVVRDAGIDIKLLLILGMPGEPKDIAQQTINFIRDVQPSNVSLSILCPIPGSEIYRHPERFGMRLNKAVPFEKYLFAFGRFDEGEEAPRFFEYEETTPFGEGMSMDEIHDNHAKVQRYLRENGINF